MEKFGYIILAVALAIMAAMLVAVDYINEYHNRPKAFRPSLRTHITRRLSVR